MLNVFNNMNISKKIILGNLLVFILFGLLSFNFINNLREEKDNLRTLAELTKNSSIILDINREISEIQRLIKVYGTTGGDAVLDNIKKSHSLLYIKLKEVNDEYISTESREFIKKLEVILKSFGKNIEELEYLYKHKRDINNNKMPKKFSEGLQLIEQALLRKKPNVQQINLQRLKVHWLQANLNALKFLEKKDFTFKKKFKNELGFMTKLLYKGGFGKEEVDKLNVIKIEFNQIFDQALQANRIYLSLVNVVMAGSSIEFSKISNLLRNDIVKNLNQVLKESDLKYSENMNETFLYLFIAIIFLIFISFYYHRNIAMGIKHISSTFNLLIEGDLTRGIPGAKRKDEIGQLAKAADTFKKYSLSLKKEKSKAKESEKSKSRFLATMSHEIRTPMNAILSCTNLLLSEKNSPEVKEMLSTIKTSGDSLLVLINDILDFSKIESGKIELENNILNLKLCVKSVIDLLEAKASQDKKSLSLNIASDVPNFINGDVTRLRQVLVNLVGNAVKFTKDKVEIKIESLSQSSKEVELKFSVIDNGIGVPKEAIGKLFQDFSQVDASTTRKFGGTGLGLAISKGIVDSMQGEIGVVSEEGHGAEFYFIIKTTIEEDPGISSVVTKYELDESTKNQELNILLAEDNSINQLVAKKILKKLGMTADVASNGLEAIELMKFKKYDLILMDQHMPEMDGVEATEKIRAMDIPQPIIYALTASAFLEDKERCLSAGMNGFLSKPIILDELKDAIHQAINFKAQKNQ